MRLTLRTMLAYMDDVLDPADAGDLRQKIEESDFASGLVDRIRGVMSKLRMDAPKLDGKGMGNDANTISEYLDSALEQDRVAEFERVCLESDKHLCEVAACHQILTIVLGKPADVAIELRERVYALGDPEKAVVHVPGAAATASHEARRGAPPTDNGRPVSRPAPLEVPEYLRGSRRSSVWPFVGLTAAALVLTLIVLAAGPYRDKVAQLFGGATQVAQNTDEEAAAKPSTQVTEKTAAATTEPATISPSEATTAAVATTDVPPAATPPTERPATESPDRIATAPTAAAPAATTTETPDVPATTAAPPTPTESTATAPTPPMVATLPKLPRSKAPPAEPPARPVEVGRYTSDGQLFATLDPVDNLWYAKQSQEIITAGERLVVLPPYRSQIALPSAVQLIFAGEGALKMDEPDASGTPRVAVEYGRFVVATAGRAGAQVQLELAGIKGLLTLADADSELAIKVARWIPPGADPEVAENGAIVIEMYNRNGRATWQPADGAKVDIPARFVHVYLGDLTPETHGPYYPPDWIDSKNIKPIDRETAEKLEKMLDRERPLVLSLQEAMKDRRVEVRALVARCLVALGEFEPILKEFNDPNQYSYWQSEFDSLRQALARGPQTAAKIHQTVNLVRPADANDLYRLLWSYNDEQLSAGGSAQLVKLLEHDQLDMRVLAYVNLVSITGQFGSYRPERPKAQMKVAVADWGKRRDKGAIINKSPPSPLDTYKPIVPADAKSGTTPAATNK
jgi:hypothetical protein